MEAGEELDALVAQRVMGWRLDVNLEELALIYVAPDGSQRLPEEVPPYSTNIEAAWEVVDRIATTYGAHIDVTRMLAAFVPPLNPWLCRIASGSLEYPTSNLEVCEGANTAPLAICLAALKAVGV